MIQYTVYALKNEASVWKPHVKGNVLHMNLEFQLELRFHFQRGQYKGNTHHSNIMFKVALCRTFIPWEIKSSLLEILQKRNPLQKEVQRKNRFWRNSQGWDLGFVCFSYLLGGWEASTHDCVVQSSLWQLPSPQIQLQLRRPFHNITPFTWLFSRSRNVASQGCKVTKRCMGWWGDPQFSTLGHFAMLCWAQIVILKGPESKAEKLKPFSVQKAFGWLGSKLCHSNKFTFSGARHKTALPDI